MVVGERMEENRLIIEDKVCNKISQSIDLSILNEICKSTEIYPESVILVNSKDYPNDKLFYLRRNIYIVISDKKYNKKFLDWCLVHEHRHLQQMVIKALNKEIRSLIKVRRYSVHRQAYENQDNSIDYYGMDKQDGIDWEKVYQKIDWNRLVMEHDACIYASQYCGYLRPRREFRKK
jgi:hypothetical protein